MHFGPYRPFIPYQARGALQRLPKTLPRNTIAVRQSCGFGSYCNVSRIFLHIG